MAKQQSPNSEGEMLAKREAELATLNADIELLTEAADCMEQSSTWTYNAWCAAYEMSDRESSRKLNAELEKLSKRMDGMKAEVDALLKSYKDALPTLTKLVGSHRTESSQGASQETQPSTKQSSKRSKPTKSAASEEAEAKLTAKADKGQKIVKAKAKTNR